MTEYIERRAAIAETRKPRLTDAELRRRLAEFPAADVVPVVRCKDCRYWNSARISCEGLARCLTGESGVRFRNANDFCSRGVRKDVEGKE